MLVEQNELTDNKINSWHKIKPSKHPSVLYPKNQVQFQKFLSPGTNFYKGEISYDHLNIKRF